MAVDEVSPGLSTLDDNYCPYQQTVGWLTYRMVALYFAYLFNFGHGPFEFGW